MTCVVPGTAKHGAETGRRKICNSRGDVRVVAPDPTAGMIMPPRSLLLGLCVLAVWRPHVLAAQARAVADTAALQRLLVAEDARGTGHDGLAPLLETLQGTDTLLRRLSVRGLGRLQRPELGRML